MSISAMKQALEALALFASDESDDGQMAISAYETLRQAIAEAEKQEPVAQCTYPKCQATNGCVGACSKTAPVHAIDMSEKNVRVSDEEVKALLSWWPSYVHYTTPPAAPVQEPEEWDGRCVLGHCGSPTGCELSKRCRADNTPAAQRQWVGLTDEEIYDYADKFLYQHGSNYGIKSFGKAIEAKLKEKNT